MKRGSKTVPDRFRARTAKTVPDSFRESEHNRRSELSRTVSGQFQDSYTFHLSSVPTRSGGQVETAHQGIPSSLRKEEDHDHLYALL